MNTVEIAWTRTNNGLRIEYVGSNGVVITRKGIGSKLYSGRNRQGGNKGYYYEVNGKGWYGTLKSAKIAASQLESK